MSKNQALEQAIKRNHVFIKRYLFTKNDVNLPFSLNINNKIEMQTFIELMEDAIIEVREDINNLDKK